MGESKDHFVEENIPACISSLLSKEPNPWDHPAITRQIVKHLKSLQQTLQQNNSKQHPTDNPSNGPTSLHNGSPSQLLPILQTLFSFGITKSTTTSNPSVPLSDTLFTQSSPLKPPQSNSSTAKYIPPALRHRYNSYTTSESDTSDAEHSNTSFNSHRATKIRLLALTCIQLAIKSNSKSFHPHWPALLASSDTLSLDNASHTFKTNHASIGSASTTPSWPSLFDKETSLSTLIDAGTSTIVSPLLYDPSSHVRHAAAVTLSTLLEGPAQRAYLAVAEWKEASPHHTRGFVPLSSILGQIIIGTHIALLSSLLWEHDGTVLLAVLRALSTLIVGSPYHRLSSALPVLSMNCLWSKLAVVVCNGEAAALEKRMRGMGAMNAEGTLQIADNYSVGPQEHGMTSAGQQQQLVSAIVACCAGLFGAKPPLPSLDRHLTSKNYLDWLNEGRPDGQDRPDDVASFLLRHIQAGAKTLHCEFEERTLSDAAALRSGATATGIGIATKQSSIQLEALMALRGLASQYTSVIASNLDAVTESIHRIIEDGMLTLENPKSPIEKDGVSTILADGNGGSDFGCSVRSPTVTTTKQYKEKNTDKKSAIPQDFKNSTTTAATTEHVIQQCLLLLGDILHIDHTSAPMNTQDGTVLRVQTSILRYLIKRMLLLHRCKSDVLYAAVFTSISRVSVAMLHCSIPNKDILNRIEPRGGGIYLENCDDSLCLVVDLVFDALCMAFGAVYGCSSDTLVGGAAVPVLYASPGRSSMAKAFAHILCYMNTENKIAETLESDVLVAQKESKQQSSTGARELAAAERAMPAVAAFCQDSVLAVRIQGAAALANLGSLLLRCTTRIEPWAYSPKSTSDASTEGTALHGIAEQLSQPSSVVVLDVVRKVYPLAVRFSTKEHEKVRADGVLALGYLLSAVCVVLIGRGEDNTSMVPLIEQGFGALQECLKSCMAITAAGLAKVQWNACSAAAMVIKTIEIFVGRRADADRGLGQKTLEPFVHHLRDALELMKDKSDNARTRLLAGNALLELIR